MSSSGRSAIRIEVLNAHFNSSGEALPLRILHKGAGTLTLQAFRCRETKPNEQVITEAHWNQELDTYPDSIMAPPGNYEIKARVQVADVRDYCGPSNKSLEVATTIQIAGTANFVYPIEALDIALKIPNVREWYDLHSCCNSMKIQTGNDPVKPAHRISMKSDYWEIELTDKHKIGPDPLTVVVIVSSYTGDVLSNTLVPS